MPLASRRDRDRPLRRPARADVCAATDVLGHGVNLPCETLLFAETTKFDGQERRDLHAVGDRADRGPRRPLRPRRARPRRRPHRHRLGAGRSGARRSRRSCRTSSSRAATSATASSTRRGCGRGSRICRSTRPAQLAAGAARVAHGGAAALGDGGLALGRVDRPAPRPARRRAATRCASAAARSRSSEIWKLVNAPVDEDNVELLGTLALAVAGDRAQRPMLDWLLDPQRLRDASLEDAEQAARDGEHPALVRAAVPGRRRRHDRARRRAGAGRRRARQRAARGRGRRSPSVGRCRSCGRSCAPWFALCDRCYSGRR